jgi:hypothetical protein
MVLTVDKFKKLRISSIRLNLLLLAVSLLGVLTAYLAIQVFVALRLSQFLLFLVAVFLWMILSLIFDLTTQTLVFLVSLVLIAVTIFFNLLLLTADFKVAISTGLIFAILDLFSFWQLQQLAQVRLKVDWPSLFQIKWNAFSWTVIVSMSLFILFSLQAGFVSKEKFIQIMSFTQPLFKQTKFGLTPSTTVSELATRSLPDDIKKLNGQLREAAISLAIKQLSERFNVELSKEDTLSESIFKYLNQILKTASQDQVRLYALKLSSIVILIIILQPIFWFWGWILSYLAILPLMLLRRLGLYTIEPETVSRDKIVV